MLVESENICKADGFVQTMANIYSELGGSYQDEFHYTSEKS